MGILKSIICKIIAYLWITYKWKSNKRDKQQKLLLGFEVNSLHKQENILDGCFHVYIDVGSNIGIQVRKLYESHLYPKAKVKQIFEHFFGSPDRRNETVCAIGFEPNPNHTQYLQGIIVL